jgi:hypothetical protein
MPDPGRSWTTGWVGLHIPALLREGTMAEAHQQERADAEAEGAQCGKCNSRAACLC